MLVAEADGEVAGYLFARMEAESFEAALAGCAWIHDIFVAESARGLRIGARLVEAAAEWARALGSRALMLSVAPQNDAARALFGRHGFRVTMQEMRLDFEDKS